MRNKHKPWYKHIWLDAILAFFILVFIVIIWDIFFLDHIDNIYYLIGIPLLRGTLIIIALINGSWEILKSIYFSKWMSGHVKTGFLVIMLIVYFTLKICFWIMDIMLYYIGSVAAA